MAIETPPLEELMKQWEKDSEVDTTEPGKEILRIPLIHNKYNKYLSLHNLSARKCGLEYNRVKKLKWMYYSDDDLNKLKRKQAYHEEAANFCTNVMKELNNRTWQLREYMGWEKFIQGAK